MALTRKAQLFKWTEEYHTTLDTLIKAITSGLELSQPDPSWPFFLQVDASAYVTGAILTQLDDVMDTYYFYFFSLSYDKMVSHTECVHRLENVSLRRSYYIKWKGTCIF